MPKIGMEPIRREALIKATISEIGKIGSLNVTVSQISKQAGVSSALAHHYFGTKEFLFIGAMRHILAQFKISVVEGLNEASAPYERVMAIVNACFEPENFSREVISAWLNFYVLAQTNEEVFNLLRIYQIRLHSNLVHALKPLLADRAEMGAKAIAALIDGLYIQTALKREPADHHAACQLILSHLDIMIEKN